VSNYFTKKAKPGMTDWQVCGDRHTADNTLPTDVLEVILGFVNTDTLRTARLVSRAFCTAAGAHICTLDSGWRPRSTLLSILPQAASLRQFPGLRTVSVHVDEEDVAQIDPCLRDLITTLCISSCEGSLSELAFFPKLRELNISVDVRGTAETLRGLTNVAALQMGACNLSAAMIIPTMTWLTSLDIGHVYRPGRRQALFAQLSWLEQATSLTNLQSLRIISFKESLALIGNLTSLTGLTWLDHGPNSVYEMELYTSYSIAPFTRLTRLRSLEMDLCKLSEGNVEIAGSLASGSLLELNVQVSKHASPECGRFLARQTALTHLSLTGAQVCDMRHIGALRVEVLQSLQLWSFDLLDAEGFLALRRATALTRLAISMRLRRYDLPLSIAIAGLTQLRSLFVSAPSGYDTKFLDYPLAVSPLTSLTVLSLYDARLDDGDIRALLGLAGLRHLTLCGSGPTDDVLRELGVLTNLEHLDLGGCAPTFKSVVKSLAPVTDILNPLREARGWRPMCASC
jgi:hypothetical protein